MRAFFPAFVICVSAVFTGCFSHKEAPQRLETATSVSEAVANREAVQRIILNDADFKEIPAELASMPSLEVIYLRNTQITNFTMLVSLTSVKELDLSNIKMASAPDALEAMAKLEKLYLSGCGLKSFPASIATSGQLTYLNLDRNNIESLPETLPVNLRWLRLNSNALSSIPEALGKLTKLQRIYLRDNRLSSLPQSMSALTEIEDVMLAGNHFDAFPSVLTSLPKLRNLDLRGNPGITSLPENIGVMKSLRTLTLTGCRIPKQERDRIQAALPDCVINF